MKKILVMFLLLTSYGFNQVAVAQGEESGYIVPTDGYISSPIEAHREFTGRPHEGLDIAAPTGAPVVAAADGVVHVRDAGGTGPGTGYDPNGYGDYVYIEHPDGTVTIYAHLDSVNVQDGQTVSQGEQIGTVGNTGGSHGPHLHFEISESFLGEPLEIDGQYWDAANGIVDGSSVSQGTPINLNGSVVTEGNIGQTPEPNTGGRAPPSAPPANSFCGGTIDTSQSLDIANINLEGLLPTPTMWLRETMCLMAEHSISKQMNNLGFVLLFACFVYALLNATYFYRSDQYFSLFGRLILAAGLLWGQPVIAKSIMNSWTSMYNIMQTNVVSDATTELETNLNYLGPQLKELAITTAMANFGAAVFPDIPLADLGEELVKVYAEFTSQGVKALFSVMVLMGSLYGIYFIAIYVSGLIAVLAGVLLSVLVPFLVLPGMASWFTRWFTMVFLSLTMVVVLPFAFSIAVRLGVTVPMAELSKVSEAIIEKHSPENQSLAGAINVFPELLDLIKRSQGDTSVDTATIQQLYFRWVFALVILALAVLAAIFMLQQLPRIISGFIGGTPGGSASPVSGGVLGATLAGAAASLGGGAGRSAAALSGALAGKGGGGGGGSGRPGLPPSTGTGRDHSASASSPSSSSGSGAVQMNATVDRSGSGNGASIGGSSSSSGGRALAGSSGASGSGGASRSSGTTSSSSSSGGANASSGSSRGSQQLSSGGASREGSVNARGNLSNDPSVRTVDTTASSVNSSGPSASGGARGSGTSGRASSAQSVSSTNSSQSGVSARGNSTNNSGAQTVSTTAKSAS
jgi:murein DD-endopeptidase MepM/ murein hydrolase activator NlpD